MSTAESLATAAGANPGLDSMGARPAAAGAKLLGLALQFEADGWVLVSASRRMVAAVQPGQNQAEELGRVLLAFGGAL